VQVPRTGQKGACAARRAQVRASGAGACVRVCVVCARVCRQKARPRTEGRMTQAGGWEERARSPYQRSLASPEGPCSRKILPATQAWQQVLPRTRWGRARCREVARKPLEVISGGSDMNESTVIRKGGCHGGSGG